MVDLPPRRHQEIKAMFDEVENAAPEDRTETFQRLVRLLAVHETAEEEIVHPYARRKLDHGEDVVDERLAEENSAKDMLTQMERAPERRGRDGTEEPARGSARRDHGQDPGRDPQGDGQAGLRAARSRVTA
ncbi:hemerythrin domain-containing protein [Nonomuraea cypriaca]|uniref:hemerythrin domain-containing protein n=1 Tax=Nonomuraea cypriaca TaxID=1187855 RepID=UPI002E2DEDE3|nr:hemerythrin domain-containing protein [Nonomuraea cypriaca]